MTHPNVAKATRKATPKVAVYDENGKLIGLVDPDDLQPVQTSAPSGFQPGQQDVDAAVQTVADNLAKSAAFAGIRPKPQALRKAVAVASSGAGWSMLLKELGDDRAKGLQAAVAHESLKLILAGMPQKRATALAKSTAVRLASRKGLV